MTNQLEPNEYVPVYSANGKLAGEMIRILLESMNIPAILLQESAGAVYGLTVGPLGEVKILVPANRAEEAVEILEALENGDLEASPFYSDLDVPDQAYKSNKMEVNEIIKDQDLDPQEW